AQLVPRPNGRGMDGERTAVDEPYHLVRLMGVGEVAAQDRESGEEHAFLVHPDVRGIEGEALILRALEIDHRARVRSSEERADPESVPTRTLHDEIGRPARIVGGRE